MRSTRYAWKKLAFTLLLLPCLWGVARGQNSDNTAVIDNIVSTYSLPPGREGLSESAFRLKVKVMMSRWQSQSDIILNIGAQQGTSLNPNPSFKHSYAYDGRQYGDQHVGQGPFQSIRAAMLRYKVTVMCNGQTWTREVDGISNQFGPVARDTKASAVTLFVEVAGIGDFNGTGPIRNAIEGILQREAEAKRAAEQARLQKEADAKAAEQARLQREADAKAAAARQASAAKTTTATSPPKTSGQTSGSKTSGTSSAKTSSASSTASSRNGGSTAAKAPEPAADPAPTAADAKAEQARAATRQRQEAAERETARAEAERQRKAQEEAAAQKRQADYDQWKSQKKTEQAQAESAALASSIGLAAMMAELLYADMGKYNPDFVYRPTSKTNYHAPRFFVSTQFGFSGTVMPLLFESHVSTMKSGKAVTTESIKDVQPFWLNLEGVAQLGAESDLYGGYAYWHPKAGLSPIFTGHNLSVLSGGARIFAGSPGVKLYLDISRNYFSASRTDNDAEESGQSTLDFVNRHRTEVGVRFTCHNEPYVRSHLCFGVVWEKLVSDSGKFYYVNTAGNTLVAGPTPTTMGFTASWKQDHSHQLYVNFFPNYWLTGDISNPKNFSPSTFTGTSAYSRKPTSSLLEFGFIRSIDWFN